MSTDSPSARPRSLRTLMSWTLAGNLVAAGSQFLMVALLARLGSPQHVGLYALGLALTAPVFQFLGFQLRGAQATDVRGEYAFAEYVGLKSVGLTLASVAVLTYVFVREPRDVFLPLLLFVLVRITEGLSEVIAGAMQSRERLDQIATAQVVRSVGGLASFGVLFWATRDLAWAMGGVLLANAAVLLAYEVPRTLALKLPGTPALLTRRLWQLARLTLPLGVVMGLVSLGANIPRLFIEDDLGRSALGVFAALSYVPLLGAMVVNALGQAASARLAAAFASDDPGAFGRLLGRLLLFGAAIGLLGVLAAALLGRPALGLLYGPEYARHAGVLVWLMVGGAMGFVASFAGFGVTSARRFWEQLPLFVASTVLLYFACAWLVPAYGLVGAALASLVTSAVQLVGSLWILRQARRPRA